LKHGNVAPSLQAAQTALEHERIVDNLEKKKLEHRSDKEDLENRNILRHGNVAPALQAAQTALEHERIVDTLEKKNLSIEVIRKIWKIETLFDREMLLLLCKLLNIN